MKNNIQYFIILFLVGFMSLTFTSASIFISPQDNDTIVSNYSYGSTTFIIQANVTDTAVLYTSATMCILKDGYCKFKIDNTEFVEGFNNLEFEVIDSIYNSSFYNITLFYYQDMKSLEESIKSNNLESNFLTILKDWILKIVDKIFFKKGDNLYATKYTCIDGIVDLTKSHTIQCNSTGMYIIG